MDNEKTSTTELRTIHPQVEGNTLHQFAKVRSLATILADPAALVSPKAILPGLAYRARVTLFAAREKDGKSTLAGAGAASVSRGAPFLGSPTSAGQVLWDGLEEHVHDAAQRFVHFGAEPENILLLDDSGDALSDLENAVAALRPILVIVDTLAALADGHVKESGSSVAWTPIMRRLSQLARDYDCALLLLGHARKSDGKYRDSTAIGAGVDAVLEMSTGDGSVRKITGKGRWRIDPVTVRLEGDEYVLVEGEISSAGADLEEQILQFVTSNPGVSARRVRDGVKGRAEKIDEAVERLLSASVIGDRGQRRRRKLYVCAGTDLLSPGDGLDVD